ncbi:hypothetical protein GOP47_0004808 [Adiantum capillus-veneris]|uniref:Uncharacterized protein n=1 Tax=Adiantum capillus-veneris TaxID=13818 RepID=A0A9D4ZKZ4_ADICA|nr:hypothetical protein GOP47_0004808 [Adiantum capillus-veneris]
MAECRRELLQWWESTTLSGCNLTLKWGYWRRNTTPRGREVRVKAELCREGESCAGCAGNVELCKGDDENSVGGETQRKQAGRGACLQAGLEA